VRNVGKGRTAASVILVGLDNEDMGMIREVLAAEAVLPSASVSFGDATTVVKRGRPDVVIIGFNQAKDAAIALGQALSKEVHGLTLVALSRRSDANDILAAMRVGYKEYVVLPDDANRLRQAVHDAAYAPGDDDEKGLVVALCGAKGGVGTTLLTTHLASELAAIHRVLCIDLDFSVGDVASMMDVQPKDTITDLLPRADRIDERLLTGAVAVHKSKVHILAQPSELERIEEVRADDVYAIINAAAKGYQYVIIDCGVRWDEASALAMSVADIILMIATPDVIGVRDAYRRLKLFEVNGLEKDRVRLVVNRWSKTAFVKNEDIEQNLGLKVVATVADDPRTVDQAINEGKLVRAVNKKSDTARDISTLVALLTEGGEPAPVGGGEGDKGGGGGFFGSWFSRG
jgi:pilus assembly protein CpaE